MKRAHLLTAALTIIIAANPSLLSEDIGEPQQSKTGPIPPKIVLERDKAETERLESLTLAERKQLSATQHTISGVPEYLWRHGCGPTSVGMVVGYYDTRGYRDLIPGEASTQTAAVTQAIASGGDSSKPNGPGLEKHYEDYARPEDSSPNMLADDYIGKRSPHTDDSIADYMDTSKSTRSNYYGWSWSNDVGPSFLDYVNQQNSSYNPSFAPYWWSSALWDVLRNEINSNRPMVFLVDTDGNGSTDHFVPVIGYDDGEPHKYACYTTWASTPGVRWYTFQNTGHPWGIWGGWSFNLKIAGDFDSDGLEDLTDFAIFASAWMSRPGQPNWNSACDISKDNIINWPDLAVFSQAWLTDIE